MGFEQRLGHQFQSGMTGNQLPDTFGERAFGGLADLQAKAPQHAAQAVLDVAQLRLAAACAPSEPPASPAPRSTCNALAGTSPAASVARYHGHRCGPTSLASP